MKIRNGFVSNSSSSSFIVLLPEGFELDLSNVDYFRYKDTNDEEVRELFAQLLIDKTIWAEESGDAIGILEDVLKDYVVAQVETGPDNGTMVLADPEKVKKILGA